MAYLSFGTQKGGYETDGKMLQTFSTRSSSRLQRQLRDRAERDAACGNWCHGAGHQRVAGTPDLDRRAETPAQLKIERIGSDDRPAPLDPLVLQGGLTRAAQFVEQTSKLFADWAASYRSHVNALPPADQARASRSAAIRTSITTTRAGRWPTTKHS